MLVKGHKAQDLGFNQDYRQITNHKTYQLKISKTCKLPTVFSKSGGGDRPPPIDSYLSQPWNGFVEQRNVFTAVDRQSDNKMKTVS